LAGVTRCQTPHPSKVSSFTSIAWQSSLHHQTPRVSVDTTHTVVAWLDHPHRQALCAIRPLCFCSYRLAIETSPPGATPWVSKGA